MPPPLPLGATTPPRTRRARRTGTVRRWAAFGLMAAAAACTFPVAGCQPPASSPSVADTEGTSSSAERVSVPSAVPSRSPLPPPVQPDTAATEKTDAALQWWKRTLDAPRTVPVRASVVVTRFDANKPPAISRYELVEALGGRKYRITYHAPASAAGRIVLCDGQTLWQYEPNHDTVLRRPVAGAPLGDKGAFAPPREPVDFAAPPSPGEDSGLSDVPGGAAVVRLQPEADSVAGRATRVLARYAGPNGGPVVERRWVDIQTGRTLRTEQYDGQKKRRRVEMTQVEFSPKIENGEFVPRLAEGVRIVDTAQITPSSGSKHENEETARRVHLPLRARGFALRSASTTKTPQARQGNAAPTPANETIHLVYSNEASSFSVFVTPMLPGVKSTSGGGTNDSSGGVVLTGAAGWKPALLNGPERNKQRVWTQETPTRTAIAWTSNTNRLVAVGQMPVRELLPLVETLASGTREKTANPSR